MMFSSLEKIRTNVISCTKCELCKSRKNAVPGKGNKNSELVFVGEAPGRSEDRAGAPFVGIAGKKFSSALEYAGISRESIYITNVVKCRPPKNRVPTRIERQACEEYLNSEMTLIKPKIICVMGNTAYQSLLGGQKITQDRGKFIRKNGKLYFLTIHPAATIYNQELLLVLRKDLKKLVKSLTKIKKGREIKTFENTS